MYLVQEIPEYLYIPEYVEVHTRVHGCTYQSKVLFLTISNPYFNFLFGRGLTLLPKANVKSTSRMTTKDIKRDSEWGPRVIG